jgi:hypothetical protein
MERKDVSFPFVVSCRHGATTFTMTTDTLTAFSIAALSVGKVRLRTAFVGSYAVS